MESSSVKSEGFDFIKYSVPVSFIVLLLLVVFNLIKNFSQCNFRMRLDSTQIFTVSRNELTPNTILLLHMYEGVAEGFFNYLDYTRRDVAVDRHNNALNSELLAKNSDLFLPAFLDLKSRSANQAMFYAADKDIDRNFYLLPVTSRYPLRFIMGDIFNLQLYQGFEARQFYYALPRKLQEKNNPAGVKISAENFEEYKTTFLNNWEVSKESFIRPKFIGLVSNIAIFKPERREAREILIKLCLGLNPENLSVSTIKKVDLSFFLNNVVIENITLLSGEIREVTLKISTDSLPRQVNFLAIVPFYNSVNCFYPSQLYPAPQGTLAKGEHPYLIKSLEVTER